MRAPAPRLTPIGSTLRASLLGVGAALLWGLMETVALWRTRRLRRLDRQT